MKPILMDAMAQTWIFKAAASAWCLVLFYKFIFKDNKWDMPIEAVPHGLKDKVNALRKEVQFSKQSIDQLSKF